MFVSTHSFRAATLLGLLAVASPAWGQFMPGAGMPPLPPPNLAAGPTITSVPTTTYPVAPVGGFVPGFPGFGVNFDPFGGYFRGVADLTAAQGQYNKDINTARLYNQQVEQEKIRTRRMLQEQRRYEQSLLPTAEEIREKQQQVALRRAMNDPPLTDILSADALNTLLLAIQKLGVSGPSIPLNQAMLQQIHVSGGDGGNIGVFKEGATIRWPLALRGTPFEKPRNQFQTSLEDALSQLSSNNIQTTTLRDMSDSLKALERLLDQNAADLGISEIVESQRFLSELRDGAKALQGSNASNLINRKWSARGRDVGELVANMSSQGLRFAPAGRGDEAAYRSLYQALVTYQYTAAQARR